VANESHNIRDFLSSHNISIAALLDEIGVDIMFLRCQNSGLMKAYTCCMYVQVQKDDIHVANILWQTEMVWEEHEGIRQNVIHSPVSFPKLSIGKILGSLVRSLFTKVLSHKLVS
jgi:hypothetical protein